MCSSFHYEAAAAAKKSNKIDFVAGAALFLFSIRIRNEAVGKFNFHISININKDPY